MPQYGAIEMARLAADRLADQHAFARHFGHYDGYPGFGVEDRYREGRRYHDSTVVDFVVVGSGVAGGSCSQACDRCQYGPA